MAGDRSKLGLAFIKLTKNSAHCKRTGPVKTPFSRQR
jgi:hypothetical protein